MKTNEQHAILKSCRGNQLPVLERVALTARATPPLLDVTAEHHYRNASRRTLEVVYTFPVPVGAALLGFEFELGEQKRIGRVTARGAARETYDRAVENGDTAVLVEQQRDGLYTANLGNLKPDEGVVIRLRYGTLLQAQGADWRIAIPTVLAPFYGDATSDGGIDPRAVAGHSLLVDYPLEVVLEIAGDDTQAVKCISHPATVTMVDGTVRATLPSDARLDRDVVFLARRLSDIVTLAAPDGDSAVVVASTVLGAADVAPAPTSVRLVLDCSGSMAGESMDWAAVGCQKLIEALADGDEFSITRFGSDVDHLTRRLVASTASSRAKYAQRLFDVVADLGGTEMEQALRAAVALKGTQPRSEIVLLTDGEIWASDALVRWARSCGLRFFVIGVGAAPNHTFLQRLAAETGGSCDFVTPGEDMLAAVARVVERLRQPRSGALDVRWPAAPSWTLQLPAVAHAGQAVHVMAGFEALPAGRLTLDKSSAALPDRALADATLARVVAYQRLLSGHFEDPAQAAERYQLVTEWTHLIAVLERAADDKAVGLPDIAPVEQMLAAGWAGTGGVLTLAMSGSTDVHFDDLLSEDPRIKSLLSDSQSRTGGMVQRSASMDAGSLDFDIPTTSAEERRTWALLIRSEDIAPWVRAINRRIVAAAAASSPQGPDLAWCSGAMPAALIEALRREVEKGQSEAAIVLALLEILVGFEFFGDTRFSEHSKKWIKAKRAAMGPRTPEAQAAADRAFEAAFSAADDEPSKARRAAA